MLWYKSWLETRWRFYLGLVLLTSGSASAILGFPAILENRAAALQYGQHQFAGPAIARSAVGSLEQNKFAERVYRAYAGMHWFADDNTIHLWSLLAILVGFHGMRAEKANGTASYTLSLPISRRRLLSVRAAVGAIELAIAFVVPSLLIPLLASVVGARYSMKDATLHALAIIAAGMVFYSASFFLATHFASLWTAVIGYLLFTLCSKLGFKGGTGFTRIIAIDMLTNQGSGEFLGRIGLLLFCGAGLIYLSVRQFKGQDF